MSKIATVIDRVLDTDNIRDMLEITVDGDYVIIDDHIKWFHVARIHVDCVSEQLLLNIVNAYAMRRWRELAGKQ